MHPANANIFFIAPPAQSSPTVVYCTLDSQSISVSTTELLRFISPRSGPIVAITSAPYPSSWRRRLWYSTAKLHPRWQDPTRKCGVLLFGGGGWSTDKEESQCKAVTEAIERWAFRYYAISHPEEIGFESDPTTNGFAALPAAMGSRPLIRHAYHEALERWALNRFWDEGNISFNEVTPPQDAVSLFGQFKGRVSCYVAALQDQSPKALRAGTISFCLAIFTNDAGGVVPGSACGDDLAATTMRASLEAYIHARAAANLKGKAPLRQLDITEQRLLHFSTSALAGASVKERLLLSRTSVPRPTPPIMFSKHLPGPWEPEIRVHRVLVADSKPITCGGIDRFII